ncbi:MAG: thioredoxin [Myxococcota bacterium]
MSDIRHYRCSSCGGVNRLPADKVGNNPTCGRCGASLDARAAPQKVDDDELEHLIANAPVPVLVDFYADWCGPCRALAPTVAELGQNHAGDLIIVKVDTDDNQRVARSLGVRGIPALFLYKGGQVVEQAAGAQSLGALEELVEKYL